MKKTLQQQLLASLDDIPRLVETRDLLRHANSQVLSFADHNSFAVWLPSEALGAIVGQPSTGLAPLHDCDEIIAFANNYQSLRTQLPNYHCQRVNVYLQPSLVASPRHTVKAVTLHDIEYLVDEDNSLFAELKWALIHDIPVWASMHNQQPVAFAYAGAQSEGYWDMAIDTLLPYRGQGFAHSAASAMLQHMHGTGKRGVWSALHSNPASNRLALKLGYQLVDELWLFSAQ